MNVNLALSFELPVLPGVMRSYRSVPIHHGAEVCDIITFIAALMKGAPAFLVIIIALVPSRLLVTNRTWHWETFSFAVAWACRTGTPGDEEDAGTDSMEAPPEGEISFELEELLR